jgi:MoaA/NifB/PqqE/SkfB family radical SAM enzyme
MYRRRTFYAGSFDILAEIINRGFDVYLLTNGMLIGKKKAQGLFNLGVKGVQVSIEGPEAVHNAIRGNGSFSGSLKGVKNILDAGLKVTLNTTLSRMNAVLYGHDRTGFRARCSQDRH